VLSGGNSDPKEGNSLQAWTDLYDRIQRHTADTRLKIPLLYGIDAVHGHSNLLGAVIFPHNIGLSATRDAALVEKIGRITAKEIRASGRLGFTWPRDMKQVGMHQGDAGYDPLFPVGFGLAW
jgi:beta-glucosidase